MGKQSKLKKMRKESLSEPKNQAEVHPEQFVKNIEKEGYSFKKIERSPEIKEQRIEPQI